MIGNIIVIFLILQFVINSISIPILMNKIRKQHKKTKELEYTIQWVVTNCDIPVRNDIPEIIWTYKPLE